MTNATYRQSIVALAFLIAVTCSCVQARAQKREHLTLEEIEFVRDAQKLDERTGVFIKAAERRLRAIATPASKQLDQDKQKWGDISGTRRQLLQDIFKIMDEAVVNIDDTHLRDPNSALLSKSLLMLANAASRFVPELAPLRQSAESAGEREMVDDVITQAEEIIAAAKRHGVAEKVENEKAGKKGSKQN